MKRIAVPGGWYCDALPDGRYVAALHAQRAIRSHVGVTNVGKDLLFIVLGDRAGETVFAGQDQAGGGNFEGRVVDPLGALTKVGDSFGVYPVIYDKNGVLHQVPAGASHQGYRFVRDDNSIATGDETIFDGVLHEWTDCGDVRIGQGQESGCIVRIDGAYRVIEPGACFSIRAKRAGDRFSIAIVKLQEGAAVIVWATREELAGLPLQTTPPVVVTPPPPLPPPPPKKDPMTEHKHFDVVQRVVASGVKPDGTLAGNFAFIAVVRAQVGDGAGFVKSRAGAENTIAYDDGFVRTSRLIYPDGHLYKLIGDAGPGGANTPQWSDEGLDDPSLYVAAVPDTTAPPPVLPPPVPAFDPTPLVQEIARLSATIEAQRVRVDDLVARLNSLAARRYKVVGPSAYTGRGPFAHSHQIDLPVVPVE